MPVSLHGYEANRYGQTYKWFKELALQLKKRYTNKNAAKYDLYDNRRGG